MVKVKVPLRMRHLERDHRNYPIPVMVFRDKAGRPHFTINDEAKRTTILIDDLCSICGKPLLKTRWFAGGPMSAFHPNGAYMDPPMHIECMRYAMQVCPYLAMPVYGKRIDARTIREPEPSRIFIDYTQMPDRPVVFVCVGAIAQEVRWGKPLYISPKRPYKHVEFWQHGKQLPHKVAMDLIAQERIGLHNAAQSY